MKNKTDNILLIASIVTLFISVLFHSLIIADVFNPIKWLPMGIVLLVGSIFPVFPSMLIQVLICRAAKHKWVRAIPLAVVLILFIISAKIPQLELMPLVLCQAPVIGCIFGFILYAYTKSYNEHIKKHHLR